MKVLENFFVLEGVDGVGKSTVLSVLKEMCEWKGKNASFTAEPGYRLKNWLAEEPLRWLSSEMLAYLYAADRYDHIYKEGGIIDRAHKGAVFCDRYRFSSTVYQAAAGRKTHMRSPSVQELVWHLNSIFPYPQAVFLLDAPAGVILERQKARDGKADSEKRVEQLANAYRSHMQFMDKEGPRGMAIHILDAELPPEDSANEIYEAAFGEEYA